MAPTSDGTEVDEISTGEILKMNAPDWHLILLACFGSITAGLVMPASTLLMSEIIGVSR